MTKKNQQLIIIIDINQIFVCLGRYFAIFPLSFLVNLVAKYRNGVDSIPREHSIILFWAGMRNNFN